MHITTPFRREFLSTGIPGLDDILRGGLTVDRMYLVEGDPGAGKTTLALQFLLAGVELGETCLYITLSETREEVLSVAASHGWDLSRLNIFEMVTNDRTMTGDAELTMFHPSEVELAEATRLMLDEINRVKPRRIVIDSLSEVRLVAQNSLRYRRQILSLKHFFAGCACTVLMLDDNTASTGDDGAVHSVAHGVITLEHRVTEYGSERRRVRVQKFRGLAFRGGYHDFVIRTGGLQMFPRLIAAEHEQQPGATNICSGIAALDELLGGGLPSGTSTLMLGPAGTGKSTVAASFAVAAAARGIRTSIYVFDENIGVFLARCRGVGMAIDEPIAGGLIRIQQIDPAELSPGEFIDRVRRHVTGPDAATIIVIDSLNGYLNAMPEEKFLIAQMHELLAFLGQTGVLTIMTVTQSGMMGSGMRTPVDTTYLADNVVLFRYFEAHAEVRRAISVVKKRNGPHERTIRELSSSAHGIVVGEPLRDFHGVLSGTPTFRPRGNVAAEAATGGRAMGDGTVFEQRAEAELRVLLLAPTARDAATSQRLLVGQGLACMICPTMDAMCDAFESGAGALIVSEESLVHAARLTRLLAAQPIWSDVTVVILSRSGSEGSMLPRVVSQLGNVSIIERPVRLSTFASTINVALRARERQYQARDMLLTSARLVASERSANEQLDALLGRERGARADAEQANRMKDEFLATLSHELRTPLSAILGWSQMLARDGVKPESLRKGLDTIERNARAQTRIIEDLLDMSRIISGKVVLDARRIDLGQVVGAAIDTVRAALVAKEIDLAVAPTLTAGAMPVLADANRMQQVFWNLLSNAIKFTPRRGTIRIDARHEHDQWHVTVADTGEGIRPAFLPFVFDRFRQADASITRAHGGLGLGLSIVRQLVELHGGSVGVESAGRGAGSTFRVSLPANEHYARAIAEPAEPTVAAGEVAAPAAASAWPSDDASVLAGLRIVIVDDESDARDLLSHVLESFGATVASAAGVAEAMDLIRRGRPDVLVSDIGMPGDDGYTLIGQIRAAEPNGTAAMPAIALTAYAREEDRAKALAAGFQMHLAKPVDPIELIASVARLAGAQKNRVPGYAGRGVLDYPHGDSNPGQPAENRIS